MAPFALEDLLITRHSVINQLCVSDDIVPVITIARISVQHPGDLISNHGQSLALVVGQGLPLTVSALVGLGLSWRDVRTPRSEHHAPLA